MARRWVADQTVVAHRVSEIIFPIAQQSTKITIAGREIGAARFTFASGAVLERVFMGIPAPNSSLVGRQQVIAELCARLVGELEGARAALYGRPGAGKSALALAAAYDHATLQRFRGGVLWGGFGRLGDAESILDQWASSLGLNLNAEGSAADRAERLAGYLMSVQAGKPLLLILDDVWDGAQVEPFLKFTVPGTALLLTTRDVSLARHFGQSYVAPVRELSEDQSVQLLEQRCPEAQLADPQGVREIARVVGGLPLALGLIGGRLTARVGQPQWVRATIDELRAIDVRLRLREGKAPRHGGSVSLQAVIDSSLEALPNPDMRQAFAELGVFASKPADFAPAAAISVWGGDQPTGERQLLVLSQRGLLEASREGRFTLHQVLADAARARLGEGGEVAAIRHAAFYHSEVNRRGEEWTSLEDELPQVRQAWEWTSTHEDLARSALDLLGVMRPLFERRALYTEYLKWLQRGLKLVLALGKQDEVASSLHEIGLVHQARGELDQALTHYDQALELFQLGGNRAGEATVLHNIGGVHDTRGKLEQALTYYDQALELQRELGNRTGEATTLHNIGGVHQAQGKLDQALIHFDQALTLFQLAGNRAGEATSLFNLAMVRRAQGQRQAAISLLAQVVRAEAELGHPDLAQDSALLEWWRKNEVTPLGLDRVWQVIRRIGLGK